MRMFSLAALGRFCLLVGLLGGERPRAALGQEQSVVLASRAPRFLWAAKPGRVPVEMSMNHGALLRQVVSLQLDTPTIGALLAEIERQTGIRFGFSRDILPTERAVALRADRITVGAALLSMLMDTGIDVVLSPDGKIALVGRDSTRSRRVAGGLIGRVTDAKTGHGVGAAEVFLENTRWRTTTDTSGRYRLGEVDAGLYTLTVRRLAYAKQSQRVNVQAEQIDTVNLALEPVVVALDELITTATGTQRRRDIGNAITTIRADSVLQAAPIRNLTDLLEDRVPGLTVQHTSGAPGDPARLRLRGIGSALRGNDPVVIVDGVRIYSAQSDVRSGNLTNTSTATTNRCNLSRGGCNPLDGSAPTLKQSTPLSSATVPAPSPLDQIDPNSIEKIEVFKGPSAATLYGADAANGVIVVTTKKGRPGPARWAANVTHGRTTTPSRWAEGYYRWGHTAAQGGAVRFCTILDTTCEVDSLIRFQALNESDLTILGEGRRTALSLEASGGSQALTYIVNGAYTKETGLLQLPAFEAERFRTRLGMAPPDWMLRPHRLATWSVTSNVTALLGPTAQLGLRTMVTRTEQQRSTLETQLSTVSGAYADRVNNLYYYPGVIGANVFPLKDLLNDYYQRTTASLITFNTRLDASWQPRSWFNAIAQAGIDVQPREDETLQPGQLVVPLDSGALSRGTGRSLVSTLNMQGRVRRPLRWGFVFEAVAGANLTTTTTNDVVTSATSLEPGTSTINRAKTITARENRTNTSVFGWYVEPRLVGQRLSLSTGFRLDGGSAYGSRLSHSGGGNLLALPKLNGSWVISEEPFFPFKSLFSSLRLRGAYGQAQVQPGPADRLRTYTERIIAVQPSVNLASVNLTTIGNTKLRPERSVEFEGGFDADLLDSRVSLELTAYRKTQVDAHMRVQLPPSVNGSGSIIQNIGNIRNTGVEVVLGLTPVQIPALTWNTQLIYSRNSNTLVKLGNGVLPDKVGGLVEGYPVSGRWAKPILGYSDANDNGVLERSEVRVGDSLIYMGRLLPAYTTSLHTNVALFGGAVRITAGFSYESGGTQVDQTARTNWVLSQALVDPSTPFSEQAAVLALDSTEYGMTQDISTFRFNSFAVNYRPPLQVSRLLRAQRVTIGIQGANLALRSTYRGQDPDVSSWTPGETVRDTGQLPLPRTWQLAIRLEY